MIADDDLRERLWTTLRNQPTATVEQTAVLLGIGRRQAYEACRKGQIPALRLGGRWVVSVPRLLALLGADDQDGDGQ